MTLRHADEQLLELARGGSAPAFASLLHRHRRVLQRTALSSSDPQRTLGHAVRRAMRELHGQATPRPWSRPKHPASTTPDEDLATWLAELVRAEADLAPAPEAVDPMLPGDWFDRMWVEVSPSWPDGRPRRRVPRWGVQLAAAAGLALVSATGTYLFITDDRSTEVIQELVAVPLEPGESALAGSDTGPVPLEPEIPPELFGDIELGELPSYDLTGRDPQTPGPMIGPPDSSAGVDQAQEPDEETADR